MPYPTHGSHEQDGQGNRVDNSLHDDRHDLRREAVRERETDIDCCSSTGTISHLRVCLLRK
jgi:hypothetical protein